MKSIKERFAKLKQRKLSFATKQWIIIIAAMLLGVCMSGLDDYQYRNNDVPHYSSETIVLIGEHQIEGAIYGLKFALVVVIFISYVASIANLARKHWEYVKD